MNPWSNYIDFLMLLVHRVLKTWMLRGQIVPASITVAHIKIFTHESGIFKSLKLVKINNLHTDKTSRLSLGNPTVRKNLSREVYEYKKNKYCVFNLIEYMLENHIPLGYDGPFFLHKANKKVIQERKKNGNEMESNIDRRFGLLYFDKMAKALAKRCGFKNAEK